MGPGPLCQRARNALKVVIMMLTPRPSDLRIAHPRVPACSTDRRILPLMSRADTPPSSGPALRILVADDYPDAAIALSLLVGTWGHEARAVGSAGEAEEYLADFSPHVVLLEPRMRDAAKVAAALVARRARGGDGTVLVAVSLGGGLPERAAWADMGIRHHFAKPVRDVPNQINAIVLGNQQPGRTGVASAVCLLDDPTNRADESVRGDFTRPSDICASVE